MIFLLYKTICRIVQLLETKITESFCCFQFSWLFHLKNKPFSLLDWLPVCDICLLDWQYWCWVPVPFSVYLHFVSSCHCSILQLLVFIFTAFFYSYLSAWKFIVFYLSARKFIIMEQLVGNKTLVLHEHATAHKASPWRSISKIFQVQDIFIEKPPSYMIPGTNSRAKS